MKKYNNFINENNEFVLKFGQIKNVKTRFGKYSHVIRNMVDENMPKYANNGSKVLRAMVDDNLPPKIRKFLDGLIHKLGTNNSIFTNVFAITIKEVLDKIVYTPEEEKEFTAFKNEILDILDAAKTRNYRVGDIENINLVKLMWSYRYTIFSFVNMDKAFKEIYKHNIDGLIAEKSMKDFLTSKNKKILETETEKDIFEGIDITTETATFQVKVCHNANVKGRTLYVNRTRADIQKVVSKTQKYDFLCFMTNEQIIMLKRTDIFTVSGFKGKDGSNNFAILVDTTVKNKFWLYPWKTDYTKKETGTVLDQIFDIKNVEITKSKLVKKNPL